ncbi:MAG: hypothetical protein WA741_28835 [Candidatus Sulfotelmatobacter sp.]
MAVTYSTANFLASRKKQTAHEKMRVPQTKMTVRSSLVWDLAKEGSTVVVRMDAAVAAKPFAAVMFLSA